MFHTAGYNRRPELIHIQSDCYYLCIEEKKNYHTFWVFSHNNLRLKKQVFRNRNFLSAQKYFCLSKNRQLRNVQTRIWEWLLVSYSKLQFSVLKLAMECWIGAVNSNNKTRIGKWQLLQIESWEYTLQNTFIIFLTRNWSSRI